MDKERERVFAGSCAAGAQDVLCRLVSLRLPAARIVSIHDGLVLFSGTGPLAFTDVEKTFPEFNALHEVLLDLSALKGGADWFPAAMKHALTKPWDDAARRAIGEIAGGAAVSGGAGFRFRFSEANEFVSVPKDLRTRLENRVLSLSAGTALRLEPLGGEIELLFMKRREGGAYLLAKRGERETRKPEKGELRQPLAETICSMAALGLGLVPARDDDGVSAWEAESLRLIDPFAGYGGLARAMARAFSGALVTAIEAKPDRYARMAQLSGKRHSGGGNPGLRLMQGDCFATELDDKAYDLVICDPPWGIYDCEGSLETLYGRMLDLFARVLKPGGRAFILCGAKDALDRSLASCKAKILSRADILVSGKKAAVYEIGFTR